MVKLHDMLPHPQPLFRGRAFRSFLIAGGALLALASVAAASTITYTYDAAGRLTRAEYGQATTYSEYAYDKTGNITELRTVVPTPTLAPTATPVPLPTNTPTPTVAPSPTPLPTAFPTNTPTPTAAPSPTPLPTAFPTNTPTPTATPSATPAPSGTPAPSATPAPSGTPAPSATPTPSDTPAPTAEPSPTGSPLPTAIPQPTQPPTEPQPLVIEGVKQGETPLDPEDAPQTGGATGTNVAIPPEVLRAILGNVDAEHFQVVSLGDALETVFSTGSGMVELRVVSEPTLQGGVIYRWTLLAWNNKTSRWEVAASGEIVTASGRRAAAFEATATTLTTRLQDGGSFDLDGVVNGVVRAPTATTLLGAPGMAPTVAPTGSPAPSPSVVPPTATPSVPSVGSSGGGCNSGLPGFLLPTLLLGTPLLLLLKRP